MRTGSGRAIGGTKDREDFLYGVVVREWDGGKGIPNENYSS